MIVDFCKFPVSEEAFYLDYNLEDFDWLCDAYDGDLIESGLPVRYAAASKFVLGLWRLPHYNRYMEDGFHSRSIMRYRNRNTTSSWPAPAWRYIIHKYYKEDLTVTLFKEMVLELQ